MAIPPLPPSNDTCPTRAWHATIFRDGNCIRIIRTIIYYFFLLLLSLLLWKIRKIRKCDLLITSDIYDAKITFDFDCLINWRLYSILILYKNKNKTKNESITVFALVRETIVFGASIRTRWVRAKMNLSRASEVTVYIHIHATRRSEIVEAR